MAQANVDPNMLDTEITDICDKINQLLKRENGSCFSFVLKLVQVDKIVNHNDKNKKMEPSLSSDFCIQIIFGASLTCVPLAL